MRNVQWLITVVVASLLISGCSNVPATPDPTAISMAVQATLTAAPTSTAAPTLTPHVIEVTREVKATRIVEVTRLVEVIREVMITATTEPTPQMPDIAGRWEEIYGESITGGGLGPGSVFNFFADGTVTINGAAFTYSWVDETHLKFNWNEVQGRVFEFASFSNGFTIKDTSSAVVTAFMPYTEFPVSYAALVGLWYRKPVLTDFGDSGCFLENGEIAESPDWFVLTDNGGFERYSEVGDSLASTGYDMQGTVRLQGSLIEIYASGTESIRGIWSGVDTEEISYEAYCDITLLTRTQMHLLGPGGKTVYVRAGFTKSVEEINQATPIPPTPEPTSTTTPTPQAEIQVMPNGGPLPLSEICVSNMYLTTEDVPDGWREAIVNAAESWNEAGSRLRLLTEHSLEYSLSSSDRYIMPLDFGGNLTDWYPLAECEIRVVSAANLRDTTLSTVQDRASLAGWVQVYPYPADTTHAVAAIVVLNDLDHRWSTGIPAPLSFDVETIALHELGHALGLPHLNDSDAIMTGTGEDHLLQWLGIPMRDLTTSDKEALIELYG